MQHLSRRAPGATLALSALALAILSASAAHAQVIESFIGLNTSNQLFRFTAPSSGAASSSPIATTNLAGGAGLTSITGVTGTIQSIDFRPSNGLLYGLSSDGAASPTLRLYTLNTATGAASLVSTLTASANGANNAAIAFTNSAYTIDFNPQADALRIVNTDNGNYRISSANFGTGTTFTDSPLVQVNQNPIRGIAYTNNFSGALSTQLYDTSQSNASVFLQSPPNSGSLTPIGSSGFTPSGGDLDTSGVTGASYFAGFGDGGGSFLYRFDNITASTTATALGSFANVGTVNGLAAPIGTAVAPEPGTFALVSFALLPALGIARRRRAKIA